MAHFEDCKFFLRGTCVNGLHCGFRHSEAASNTQRICNRWAAGCVCDGRCNLRHPSAAELAVPPPTPPSAMRRPRSHYYTHAQSPAAVAASPSSTSTTPPPCKFHAQGRCIKGDACPFFHVPRSALDSATTLRAAALTARSADASPAAVNGDSGQKRIVSGGRGGGGQRDGRQVEGGKGVGMVAGGGGGGGKGGAGGTVAGAAAAKATQMKALGILQKHRLTSTAAAVKAGTHGGQRVKGATAATPVGAMAEAAGGKRLRTETRMPQQQQQQQQQDVVLETPKKRIPQQKAPIADCNNPLPLHPKASSWPKALTADVRVTAAAATVVMTDVDEGAAEGVGGESQRPRAEAGQGRVCAGSSEILEIGNAVAVPKKKTKPSSDDGDDGCIDSRLIVVPATSVTEDGMATGTAMAMATASDVATAGTADLAQEGSCIFSSSSNSSCSSRDSARGRSAGNDISCMVGTTGREQAGGDGPSASTSIECNRQTEPTSCGGTVDDGPGDIVSATAGEAQATIVTKKIVSSGGSTGQRVPTATDASIAAGAIVSAACVPLEGGGVGAIDGRGGDQCGGLGGERECDNFVQAGTGLATDSADTGGGGGGGSDGGMGGLLSQSSRVSPVLSAGVAGAGLMTGT